MTVIQVWQTLWFWGKMQRLSTLLNCHFEWLRSDCSNQYKWSESCCKEIILTFTIGCKIYNSCYCMTISSGIWILLIAWVSSYFSRTLIAVYFCQCWHEDAMQKVAIYSPVQCIVCYAVGHCIAKQTNASASIFSAAFL